MGVMWLGLAAMATRAVFQLVGAASLPPTVGNILIPAGSLPFVGVYSYAVRRLSVWRAMRRVGSSGSTSSQALEIE